MKTATFEMLKTQLNGKTAFEIVVRNSIFNPALHDECVRLGLTATIDIKNRRSIFVTTPQEMDAIRTPLLRFFRTTPVDGVLEAI